MSVLLCARLNLPSNAASARIHTRLDGEPLGVETRHKIVSSGPSHYRNGLDYTDLGSGRVSLESWTVENRTHVLSCELFIGTDAQLLEGHVNCFALGWMPADQGYLDALLEEWTEHGICWDEIKLAP